MKARPGTRRARRARPSTRQAPPRKLARPRRRRRRARAMAPRPRGRAQRARGTRPPSARRLLMGRPPPPPPPRAASVRSALRSPWRAVPMCACASRRSTACAPPRTRARAPWPRPARGRAHGRLSTAPPRRRRAPARSAQRAVRRRWRRRMHGRAARRQRRPLAGPARCAEQRRGALVFGWHLAPAGVSAAAGARPLEAGSGLRCLQPTMRSDCACRRGARCGIMRAQPVGAARVRASHVRTLSAPGAGARRGRGGGV